jgi:hypothetical protein
MMRTASLIGGTLLALATIVAGVFVAALFYFHPPLGPWSGKAAAVLIGFAGLAAAGLVMARRRAGFVILAIIAVPGALLWFSLSPKNDRDWSAGVARTPTARVEGDRLTVSNVRSFTWNTDDTIREARWETRTYDLARLLSVDLVMNYWMGPHIAHTQLSFGFGDGQRLIWSIEVRTLKGQAFDAVSGLFRMNELVFIAGDERDLIRRRTHVTREDVRLYRLNVTPDIARRLLLTYAEDANELAAKPEFYNTLTTNCTTVIVRLTRELGVAIPADWRFLANGHLPSYLHEKGLLVAGRGVDELTRAGSISQRALALPDDAGFSDGIRKGVPGMD